MRIAVILLGCFIFISYFISLIYLTFLNANHFYDILASNVTTTNIKLLFNDIQ
jgi:hypothetical protein